MSGISKYAYTPEQVTAAFNEIEATLFSDMTAETVPKILVTAGLQASGKTYLLEKSLLPSGRYKNYVRLYLPEYRKKHPHYAEMIKLGAVHAYEQTEAFVREVSAKIYTKAFSGKYNIIMECAFDSIAFAGFPPLATAAGYQFEIHIVGCNQAFAHVSGIKRAFKSLENQEMERFVTLSDLDASMSNAQAIILAFETAAKAISGSQISLYERGFGALKERTLRCQSLYTTGTDGELSITGSPAPYSYDAYGEIINNHVFAMGDRDEIVKECHSALLKTTRYTEHVPDFVYIDLYGYIVKYVYR